MTAALQRLLVALAAFALLGHGGLEIAPRLVAAAASSTASAAAPAVARQASRPAAESKPVAPTSTLRTALAVQAPPSGGDTAGGRGATLSVAPHPGRAAGRAPADPVARPARRRRGERSRAARHGRHLSVPALHDPSPWSPA